MARNERSFVPGISSNEDGRIMGPGRVFKHHSPLRGSRMRHFQPGDSGLVFTDLPQNLSYSLAIFGSPELNKLRLKRCLFPLKVHALLVVIVVIGTGGNFGDDGLELRLDATGENPMEGIVIFRRDRIEFVIVAASASHGQSQKAFGDYVNTIIDDVVRHSHES